MLCEYGKPRMEMICPSFHMSFMNFHREIYMKEAIQSIHFAVVVSRNVYFTRKNVSMSRWMRQIEMDCQPGDSSNTNVVDFVPGVGSQALGEGGAFQPPEMWATRTQPLLGVQELGKNVSVGRTRWRVIGVNSQMEDLGKTHSIASWWEGAGLIPGAGQKTWRRKLAELCEPSVPQTMVRGDGWGPGLVSGSVR